MISEPKNREPERAQGNGARSSQSQSPANETRSESTTRWAQDTMDIITDNIMEHARRARRGPTVAIQVDTEQETAQTNYHPTARPMILEPIERANAESLRRCSAHIKRQTRAKRRTTTDPTRRPYPRTRDSKRRNTQLQAEHRIHFKQTARRRLARAKAISTTRYHVTWRLTMHIAAMGPTWTKQRHRPSTWQQRQQKQQLDNVWRKRAAQERVAANSAAATWAATTVATMVNNIATTWSSKDDRTGRAGSDSDPLDTAEPEEPIAPIKHNTVWDVTPSFHSPIELTPKDWENLQRPTAPISGEMINAYAATLAAKYPTTHAIASTRLIPMLESKRYAVAPGDNLLEYVRNATASTTHLMTPTRLDDHWILIICDATEKTVTALLKERDNELSNEQNMQLEAIKWGLAKSAAQIVENLRQQHIPPQPERGTLPNEEVRRRLDVIAATEPANRRKQFEELILGYRIKHPALGTISIQPSRVAGAGWGLYSHEIDISQKLAAVRIKSTTITPQNEHCSICDNAGNIAQGGVESGTFCPACGSAEERVNNLVFFLNGLTAGTAATRMTHSTRYMTTSLAAQPGRIPDPTELASARGAEITTYYGPNYFTGKHRIQPWLRTNDYHGLPTPHGECGTTLMSILRHMAKDTTPTDATLRTRAEITREMQSHPYKTQRSSLRASAPQILTFPWRAQATTAKAGKTEPSTHWLTLPGQPPNTRRIKITSHDMAALQQQDMTVNAADAWCCQLNSALPSTYVLGPCWTAYWWGETQTPTHQLPNIAPEKLSAVIRISAQHWGVLTLDPTKHKAQRVQLWHMRMEVTTPILQRIRAICNKAASLVRKWHAYDEVSPPKVISTVMNAMEQDADLMDVMVLTTKEATYHTSENGHQTPTERQWLADECARHIAALPEHDNSNVPTLERWEPTDIASRGHKPPEPQIDKALKRQRANTTLTNLAVDCCKALWQSKANIGYMSGPPNDRTFVLKPTDANGAKLTCPFRNQVHTEREPYFLHCDGDKMTVHCPHCKCSKAIGDYTKRLRKRRAAGLAALSRHRLQQLKDRMTVADTKRDPLKEEILDDRDDYQAKMDDKEQRPWEAVQTKSASKADEWYGTDPRSTMGNTVTLNVATLNIQNALADGLASKGWFNYIHMMKTRNLHMLILTETGMGEQKQGKSDAPRLQLEGIPHVSGREFVAYYAAAKPKTDNPTEGKRMKGGVVTIVHRSLAAMVTQYKVAERHVILALNSKEQDEPLIIAAHYHISNPAGGGQSRGDRSRETAHALHKDISKLKGVHVTAPVIILGDLNVAPDATVDRSHGNENATESSVWKRFTHPDNDEKIYTDLFRMAHVNVRGYTFSKGEAAKGTHTQSRIDHVLGNTRAANALKSVGIEPYSTFKTADHAPVFASFELLALLAILSPPQSGDATAGRVRIVTPPLPPPKGEKDETAGSTNDADQDIETEAMQQAAQYSHYDHGTHATNLQKLTRQAILTGVQRTELWQRAMSKLQKLWEKHSKATSSLPTEDLEELNAILHKLNEWVKPEHVPQEVWDEDQSTRAEMATTMATMYSTIWTMARKLETRNSPYWRASETTAAPRTALAHFAQYNKRICLLKTTIECQTALMHDATDEKASKAYNRRVHKIHKYFPQLHTPSEKAETHERAQYIDAARDLRASMRDKLQRRHGTTDATRIKECINARNVRFDYHQTPKDIARVLDSLLKRQNNTPRPAGVWLRDEEGNRTRYSTQFADIREYYHSYFHAWTKSPTYAQHPQCRTNAAEARYRQGHFEKPPREDSEIHSLMYEQYTPTDGRFDKLMRPATEDEWTLIWKRLGPRMQTAPGPKGIGFPIWKMAPPDMHAAIRALVDQIITTQIIPEQFREAVLFGAPKGDGTNPDELRPISMVEAVLKLATQLLATRLNKIAYSTRNSERPLFRRWQYGFRKGPGCAEPLTIVQQCIEKANEEKRPIHIVSADLRRAFDYAEGWSIQQCYKRAGLPDEFCRLMSELAIDNVTRVDTVGGLTDPVTIERGTRQGETLSPLNWDFLIDPLIELIERKHEKDGFNLTPKTHINSLVFADDTILLSENSANLRAMFKTCNDYMTYHECHYNPDKTIYTYNMKVGADTCEPPFVSTPAWAPKECASGPATTVKPNEAFRYLGMWFQANGKWDEQKKRIEAALRNMEGPLMRTLSSATPAQARYVIQSVVIPRLAYPLALASIDEVTLGKWEARIRKILRLGMRIPKSVNTGAIYTTKSKCGLQAPSLLMAIDAQLVTHTLACLNEEAFREETANNTARKVIQNALKALKGKRHLPSPAEAAPHKRFKHEQTTLASRIVDALDRSKLAIRTYNDNITRDRYPALHAIVPNYGEIGAELAKINAGGQHNPVKKKLQTVRDILETTKDGITLPTMMRWEQLRTKLGMKQEQEPNWYRHIKHYCADAQGTIHNWARISQRDEAQEGDMSIERELGTGEPLRPTAWPNHLWQRIGTHNEWGKTGVRLWIRTGDAVPATYEETTIEQFKDESTLHTVLPSLIRLKTADQGSKAMSEAKTTLLSRMIPRPKADGTLEYGKVATDPEEGDTVKVQWPDEQTDEDIRTVLASSTKPVTLPEGVKLEVHRSNDEMNKNPPSIRRDPQQPAATASATAPVPITKRQQIESYEPADENTWEEWQPSHDWFEDTDGLIPLAGHETTMKENEKHDKIELDLIVVATDGSYFPDTGEAGAAALFYQNNKRIFTIQHPIRDPSASANMAEAVALLAALERWMTTPMLIKTDCQSVIDAFEAEGDPTPNEYMRMQHRGIWRRIHTLKRRRNKIGGTVQLCKVAAHKKPTDDDYCPLNAEADIAAKQAAQPWVDFKAAQRKIRKTEGEIRKASDTLRIEGNAKGKLLTKVTQLRTRLALQRQECDQAQQTAEALDTKTLNNNDLAKHSGRAVLVRQGPAPGSAHSAVLGDTRQCVEQQRRKAAWQYWIDCPKQGVSSCISGANNALTDAVRSTLPDDAFYTKWLTRTLPTVHRLVRDNPAEARGQNPTCTICKATEERTDHITQCRGNDLGWQMALAVLSDEIAQHWSGEDGNNSINTWLSSEDCQKYLNANMDNARRTPRQRLSLLPSKIEIANTCAVRETSLWNYIHNHIANGGPDKLDVKQLLADIKEQEANGSTLPPSLLRVLQSHLHFSKEYTDTAWGAYPGVATHAKWSAMHPQPEPVDSGTRMPNFALATNVRPITASEATKLSSAGEWAQTATTQPRRLLALIPHKAGTKQPELAKATMLAKFPAGTLQCCDNNYHNGSRTHTTPSDMIWELWIWENTEAKRTAPITGALQQSVERWGKQHTVLENNGTPPSPITWSETLTSKTLERHAKRPHWERVPLDGSGTPTPWRIMPYDQIGWCGPTRLADNKQWKGKHPYTEKAHQLFTTEWIHEHNDGEPLPTVTPTECMQGAVPKHLPEILGYALLGRGELDADANADDTTINKQGRLKRSANSAAKTLASMAAQATKHIIWKRRNRLHHAEINTNKELSWMKKLSRKKWQKQTPTEKASEQPEEEEVVPATKTPVVTPVIRDMKHYRPEIPETPTGRNALTGIPRGSPIAPTEDAEGSESDDGAKANSKPTKAPTGKKRGRPPKDIHKLETAAMTTASADTPEPANNGQGANTGLRKEIATTTGETAKAQAKAEHNKKKQTQATESSALSQLMTNWLISPPKMSKQSETQPASPQTEGSGKPPAQGGASGTREQPPAKPPPIRDKDDSEPKCKGKKAAEDGRKCKCAVCAARSKPP